MSDIINVTVRVPSIELEFDVELPVRASIAKAKKALIKRPEIPKSNAEGDIEYLLVEKASGKALPDEQTLKDLFVQNGAILLLVPKIVPA